MAFISTFLLFLSFTLVGPRAWAQVPLVETYQPPVGNFKDYALSNDLKSLDENAALNKQRMESGLGFVPKVLEKGDGYAVIGSAATETALKIPLGWMGFDDGKKTRIFTPDSKVLLVLNWADISSQGSLEGFRKNFFEKSRLDLEEQKKQNPKLSLILFNLPQGGFGYQSLNMKDDSGDYSQITVFLDRSKKQGYALRVNLSAPPETFSKHLGLMGAVLASIRNL